MVQSEVSSSPIGIPLNPGEQQTTVDVQQFRILLKLRCTLGPWVKSTILEDSMSKHSAVLPPLFFILLSHLLFQLLTAVLHVPRAAL